MALVLEIQLDNKGAVKGVKQLKSEIGGLDNKTKTSSKRMSASMLSIGTAIAAAAVAAGAASIKFANMASAAEETKNKFDVIYKGVDNATSKINALSETTGYAISTLHDMVGSLGDMIKPAGFAADKAFTISTAIAQLSTDIGSFSNTNPAQVMNDFKSAIAGSMETLRKYGIDVSESALAQEAYNLGIIKSTKSYSKLSAEEKRSVRIRALLSKSFKDSKDAMGDLERTQGTYANQTRILGENMKTLGENIGRFVMPVLNSLAKVANLVLGSINRMFRLSQLDEVTKKQLGGIDLIIAKYHTMDEELKRIDVGDIERRERATDEWLNQIKIIEKEYTPVMAKTLEKLDLTVAGWEKVAKHLENGTTYLDYQKDSINDILKSLGEAEKAYKWKAENQILINEGVQEENAHTESILNFAKSINSEYGVADTKIKGLTVGAKKIEVSTNAWQIGTEKAAEGLTKAQIAAKELGETIKQSIGAAIKSALFDTGSLQSKFENIAEMFIQAGFDFGIKSILGFQHGGSFKVAGGGGQDSQLVAFKATPGERVTVSPPGSTTNNSSMNVNLNFPNVSSVDEYTVRRVIIPLIQKEVANRGVKFA